MANATDTGLTRGATEAAAGILGADTVLARGAERARDLRAARDALSSAAEGVRPAVAARVRLANQIDAREAGRTAVQRAVALVATPDEALLGGGAGHRGAGIRALTDLGIAELTRGAGHLEAAIDAEVPGRVAVGSGLGALVVVALPDTLSAEADLTGLAKFALVLLTVAVVVHAVADLELVPAHAEATGVARALVDAAVAVVVLRVAELGGTHRLGDTLVEAVDADLVAQSTHARETCAAELRRDGLAPGCETRLGAVVPDAISVQVRLLRVGDGRAVVTGITQTIPVGVGLVGVRHLGAVVVTPAGLVAVDVDAGAAEAALEHEDGERRGRPLGPAARLQPRSIAVLELDQRRGEVVVPTPRLFGETLGRRVALPPDLGAVDALGARVRDLEGLRRRPQVVEVALGEVGVDVVLVAEVLLQPDQGRLDLGILDRLARESICPHPRRGHRAGAREPTTAAIAVAAVPALGVVDEADRRRERGRGAGGNELGRREPRHGELCGREVAVALGFDVVPAALVRAEVALRAEQRVDPVQHTLGRRDAGADVVRTARVQVDRKRHQGRARQVALGPGAVDAGLVLQHVPNGVAHPLLVLGGHAGEADLGRVPVSAGALLEKTQRREARGLPAPERAIALLLGPKPVQAAVDGRIDALTEGRRESRGPRRPEADEDHEPQETNRRLHVRPPGETAPRAQYGTGGGRVSARELCGGRLGPEVDRTARGGRTSPGQ